MIARAELIHFVQDFEGLGKCFKKELPSQQTVHYLEIIKDRAATQIKT